MNGGQRGRGFAEFLRLRRPSTSPKVRAARAIDTRAARMPFLSSIGVIGE